MNINTMNNPILTIAIPTYNRPKQLEYTLSVILPQVVNDERVCLLILDNHSEVPAAEVLSLLGASVPANRIRVVQNLVNIGANANIIRCFEFCETTWLWVLGDDDKPESDAIETVLNDLDLNHSYAYYTVPAIQKPVFGVGESDNVIGCSFEGLARRFEGEIDQLAFLSASVFNMNDIRPYLIDGYLVLNTGIFHLAMILKVLLNHEKKWLISRKCIADYQAPDMAQGWGFLYIAYAIPSLFSIATNVEEARLIKKCLVKGWRFSPKKVLFSMISLHRADAGGVWLLSYLYRFISAVYSPCLFDQPEYWFRWKITSVWALFPRRFSSWYSKKKKNRRIVGVNHDRR